MRASTTPSLLPADPQPPAEPRSRSGEAQRLSQVCAWIDLHLDEDIGWDRLMRVSGLTPAQLQRLFQRHLKTTPMTYLRQRREQQAGLG